MWPKSAVRASDIGLEVAPLGERALQCGKRALGHGVVVGVAEAAQRGAYAHFRATVAERDAGVWAALSAVEGVNESGAAA